MIKKIEFQRPGHIRIEVHDTDKILENCSEIKRHQLFLVSYVEHMKESQKKNSYFHFPRGTAPKTENLHFFALKKSFVPRIKCLAQNVALIMLFQYLKRNPAIKIYFSSFSQKTSKSCQLVI